MTKEFHYALPVEQTEWKIDGATTTVLRWDYEGGQGELLDLYDKAKQRQWNAELRIDWSQPLDPENPAGLSDRLIGIFGSDMWLKLNEAERANLRRHTQSWQISQFLHGEQGALVCAAKLVQQIPDIRAKYFAATQVMDEARHVEAFSRLLREKFELSYPVTPPLKALLNDVVGDNRWDMTLLGMQVLIEGLALAAFQLIRDDGVASLTAAINAYVMEDEARHVAFGRLTLRDYYQHLSTAERREREEFVIAACQALRERFTCAELWETVGLPKEACIAFADSSETMRGFRRRLFSRIVPTVRDIGLLSPKVMKAFVQMDVLSFAQIDLTAIMADDEHIADRFDIAQKRL